MWVKYYSVLYLSSSDFIFHSLCHPPLLPSSVLSWTLLSFPCFLCTFPLSSICVLSPQVSLWAPNIKTNCKKKYLRNVSHGCGRMSGLFPASSQLSGKWKYFIWDIHFFFFFFWEKGKNVLLSSLIKDRVSNLSWHGCIILLRWIHKAQQLAGPLRLQKDTKVN